MRVKQLQSLEMTENARFSTSSDSSHLSASVTVVNGSTAENTPQIPSSGADSDSDGDSDDSPTSDDDPEPPLPEDPLQGWPQLALMMAKTPDFAAFPRFRDLNTKSLLYYQTQLTIFRQKLHKLEYDDSRKGEMWAERADKLVETDSEQFRTVKEMREVLKEYNEALLQFSRVCALPGPEPYDMRTLRQWLRNARGGNSKLRGAHNLPHTWGSILTDPAEEDGSLWRQFGRMILGLVWTPNVPTDHLDLAATKPQIKIDGFTRWVVNDLVRFYISFRKHRKAGKVKKQEANADVEKAAVNTSNHIDNFLEKTKRKREKRRKKKENQKAQRANDWVDKVKKEDTLQSWGEKRALRVTSGISTLVACLLPVVAISVLSQLQGLHDLLFCLAGFAVIFALGLIFLTQGTSSRTEIFAATAAFSAVMVVFISVPPSPVIIVPPGSTTSSASPSPVPSV